MANSTTTLSSIITYCKTFPDLAPIIQTTSAGSSLQPALTVASDVMTELVAQVFNWKWNRFLLPVVYTNSFQQDYALNIVNLGWLEHGFIVDINNTQVPQPIWPLEVVKDLERTSWQYGMPGQASWLPNDQLTYATWGATNVSTATGTGIGPNPQPNQVIATPIGVTANPSNPYLQVKDAFNNLWVVTTFGVTGATNPFITNLNPVFPTQANPNAIATTVTDGSVVWTAINPKGQGIRVNPLPPQNGVVYQINLIGQYRPFAFSNGPFTSFGQTIEPVPDDFAKYFRDGFIAMAYAHSQDPKLRGKYQDMFNNWKNSLMDARKQGDRERDNNGFYPATPLLAGTGINYLGPAYPWPTAGY